MINNIAFTKEWLCDNRVAIRCVNSIEAQAICKIFNSIYVGYTSNSCIYIPYIFMDDFEQSATVFTSDNWTGIKNVCYWAKASEVITAYEASKQPDRKIIGYRAPFDMFGYLKEFCVKKGELYVRSINDVGSYSHKGTIVFVNSTLRDLPAEIVEKWEPVYEEQKPLFGSFDDLICHLVKMGEKFESIKIGDEIIDKSKYAFTPEFEQKLNELGIKI